MEKKRGDIPASVGQLDRFNAKNLGDMMTLNVGPM